MCVYMCVCVHQKKNVMENYNVDYDLLNQTTVCAFLSLFEWKNTEQAAKQIATIETTVWRWHLESL